MLQYIVYLLSALRLINSPILETMAEVGNNATPKHNRSLEYHRLITLGDADLGSTPVDGSFRRFNETVTKSQ